MPALSIIIPMKNEENNIRLCLESILANSFPGEKYEIICVDNGSSDRTIEVAREYTKNVYQLPDKTISALRNYGAQKAQGEYLAFVDSDCVADRSWINAASIYFGNEHIVCFGSTPDIPADATWVQKTWYLNKQIREDVQQVEWLESMNLFVKRDVFLELGGFNEKLVTCEDVDLCYRIGQKYKIISDKRIRVVHLGEARTLREFFKKEMWRGQGNLAGVREHGLKLKEIPSIALPVYYALLPLVFFGTIAAYDFLTAMILLIIIAVIPSALISIYIAVKASKYDYLFKGAAVYLTFFIARAVSLVRSAIFNQSINSQERSKKEEILLK
jgi:glycosyltransferase involved in cell wall biosynthesis